MADKEEGHLTYDEEKGLLPRKPLVEVVG